MATRRALALYAIISFLLVGFVNGCYTRSEPSRLSTTMEKDIPKIVPIAEWFVESGTVDSLAFDDVSHRIAVGARSPNLAVWDFSTGHSVSHTFDPRVTVGGIAFAPGGKALVSVSSDGRLRTWSLDDWTSVESPLSVSGNRMAMNPTRTLLAVADGGPEWRVFLVDANSLEHRKSLFEHHSIVSALTFSPVDDALASGDFSETVMVWNTNQHELTATLQVDFGWILGLAFSPDGRRLAACGSNAEVYIWDLSLHTVVQKFNDVSCGVSAIMFSKTGEFLFGALEDLNTPASIRVWRTDGSGSYSDYQTGNAARDFIKVFAMSTNGEYLATGSVHGEVRILRVSDLIRPNQNESGVEK